MYNDRTEIYDLLTINYLIAGGLLQVNMFKHNYY